MKSKIIFSATAILYMEIISFGASPEWLCTEEASQRQGNTILSCGIGAGKDESSARLNAFDSAKIEFLKICRSSDDCKGRNITVEPKRTSCEQIKDRSYKCYRLVVFNIAEQRKNVADNHKSSDNYTEQPELFQPFVYEETQNIPRVNIGMSKAKLLQAFGAPQSVEKSGVFGGNGMQFFYKGKMCVYDSSLCYVIIENGRVQSTDGFKPIYTDDLKLSEYRGM